MNIPSIISTLQHYALPRRVIQGNHLLLLLRSLQQAISNNLSWRWIDRQDSTNCRQLGTGYEEKLHPQYNDAVFLKMFRSMRGRRMNICILDVCP